VQKAIDRDSSVNFDRALDKQKRPWKTTLPARRIRPCHHRDFDRGLVRFAKRGFFLRTIFASEATNFVTMMGPEGTGMGAIQPRATPFLTTVSYPSNGPAHDPSEMAPGFRAGGNRFAPSSPQLLSGACRGTRSIKKSEKQWVSSPERLRRPDRFVPEAPTR